MVRITVTEAMSVYPNGQYLSLAAGQKLEGPLAAWLIDSGCAVTVEKDDRPKPAAPAPAGIAKKAAAGTATAP
jgi:hypothetical protein